MPDILVDEGDLGPESPKQKRERSLYGQYFRLFGENPPMVSMPDDPKERILLIERALKDRQPIIERLPPDSVT